MGIEALGMHSGLRSDRAGGLTIGDGARVVVGATVGEERECPFCGARTPTSEKHCAHCHSKIVLETLWMRRLIITSGRSLHVLAGGQVRIGRPPASDPLLAAAARGDLAAIKARLDAGDELDGAGDDGVGPLHAAAWSGTPDAVRYLIAMGATLDDTDAHQRTALDLAVQRGDAAIIQVLCNAG